MGVVSTSLRFFRGVVTEEMVVVMFVMPAF